MNCIYCLLLKRFFDLSISLVIILFIWPILIFISLWLHFANKGAGAFFLQERPGRHGKIFKVIKFKTMTDERDAEGNLLPDDKRLTKVGKFVRSTSIDELPQLINVLKGDMSFIGHGRNAISWVRKFELDVWYVDHCSFFLDLKIFFLTIKKVFVREGISSDTSVTMEPFTGNN